MMTVFIRTIILYFLIMAGLRLMGKRQIGQLEPAELVLTMMISDLATVPMQDIGIPLLSGVIPILTLLSISLLLSHLSLKNLTFRELICGQPSILIRDGVVQQAAMEKNRFTINELLEQLRIQGFSRIQDVKYAVLENSGQLSVLPRASCQPPTAAQLDLHVQDDVTLPTILINDGHVLSRGLAACGKNLTWLQKELNARGFHSPSQLFLLTIDEQGHIFYIRKEEVRS